MHKVSRHLFLFVLAVAIAGTGLAAMFLLLNISKNSILNNHGTVDLPGLEDVALPNDLSQRMRHLSAMLGSQPGETQTLPEGGSEWECAMSIAEVFLSGIADGTADVGPVPEPTGKIEVCSDSEDSPLSVWAVLLPSGGIVIDSISGIPIYAHMDLSLPLQTLLDGTLCLAIADLYWQQYGIDFSPATAGLSVQSPYLAQKTYSDDLKYLLTITIEGADSLILDPVNADEMVSCDVTVSLLD